MRAAGSMDLKSLKIKTAFNNIFKPKRSRTACPVDASNVQSVQVSAESPSESHDEDDEPPDRLLVADPSSTDDEEIESRSRSPYTHRALPPVPAVESDSDSDEDVRRKKILDYAASM